MRRTLTAKLTLALVAILAVTGAAWVALTLVSNRLYQEEVDQSLNAPLAMYIADAYPLIEGGEVNRPVLKDLFDKLMVINPRIEVYLLDSEGAILEFSADPDRVKREAVDLAPIRAWIAGPDMLPLRGDDPRDPAGQKPFTAAPVTDGDALAGYLYVVLGGEKYDSVAGMVSESLIVRSALIAGGLGLLTALAVGTLWPAGAATATRSTGLA
jgi:hypothetical protein